MNARPLRRSLLILLLAAVTLPLAGASSKLHVDVGLNHFYKRRYLEAFKEFQAAVEVDPKNPEAHYNLARVYRLQGFLKEAVRELQFTLSIDPKHQMARRELAEIQSRIESDVSTRLKIEGQEEALRQRLAEVGSNPAEKRGQMYLQKGEFSRAIPEFEAAVRSDPENVKFHKLLGYLNFKIDRYADAITWYEKARRLAPGDAGLAYDVGLIYLKSGDFDLARSNFEESVRLDGGLVKAQYGLGEAFEKRGRFEDAAFQYRKCLELNPNLEQAKERVREMSARLGFTYFSRGSYYFQSGEYQKAEALLTLARQYGALTDAQRQQADEMLNASRYWVGKERVEEGIKRQRQEVRQDSYINKAISIEDVVLNPGAYTGQSVEWEGDAAFMDTARGKDRVFVNISASANPDSNMDHVFGVVFPRSLPNDPRVSIYSTHVTVKGKILGVEKLLNTVSKTTSGRRQPIVEAAEVTFTRTQYDQPLVIRY